jgi:acetyltransferase-like isoleucine patch superfamily enzyme
MTEKEKMLAGEYYFSSDKELTKERTLAREQIYIFNHSKPDAIKERQRILRSLFGQTDGGVLVEPPFHCDYGYNIHVGKQFYANFNLVILDCAKVIIGDNVFFGPNVSLFTATHPLDAKRRNKGLEQALPITIGNNVWIGGNVVINPGVTIGDNAVIGSGSVVTKSIPAHSLAVGNPCRVIRSLTD